MPAVSITTGGTDTVFNQAAGPGVPNAWTVELQNLDAAHDVTIDAVSATVTSVASGAGITLKAGGGSGTFIVAAGTKIIGVSSAGTVALNVMSHPAPGVN